MLMHLSFSKERVIMHFVIFISPFCSSCPVNFSSPRPSSSLLPQTPKTGQAKTRSSCHQVGSNSQPFQEEMWTEERVMDESHISRPANRPEMRMQLRIQNFQQLSGQQNGLGLFSWISSPELYCQSNLLPNTRRVENRFTVAHWVYA